MYTIYIYIRETTLPTSSTYAHEALTDLLQYWLEDTVDVRESGKSDELSETILRVPSQTVPLLHKRLDLTRLSVRVGGGLLWAHTAYTHTHCLRPPMGNGACKSLIEATVCMIVY